MTAPTSGGGGQQPLVSADCYPTARNRMSNSSLPFTLLLDPDQFSSPFYPIHFQEVTLIPL